MITTATKASIEFVNADKGTLILECYRCLRVGTFAAENRELASRQAVKKGWRQRKGKSVCPKCP